ncbi:MAG: response regulator [Candidatus Taylorbacteria bacterium]|nr:response regulator [Candidatus Taylorbacteria bacterium]
MIEDDAALRSLLHDKFILEGFEIIEAKDGEEGLAMALREHPDLILLDIILPKMDGITMMKKLRQTDEWGKKVPIILLTNLGVDEDSINQAVVAYEPANYLVKSDWTMDGLIDKIRERLY